MKSGTGRSDSGMMKSGSSASDRQMRSGMSRGHKGGSAMRDGAGMGQEKVKAAQQALKDKGHDPGDVDGKMGPRTQQALRDFQKTQDIQATGRLDDKTMQSLGVEVGRTSSAGESSAGGSASPGSSASGAGAASPSSSGAAGESKK
jgi:peptidoglycan hydrolase-like protein with peptidoglycan-binding domain